MPYYTAVVARREDEWMLAPADLDDLEDVAELADTVRRATGGEGGLAVVEHEDDWFALVRVDGEDDPRIFVSDVEATLEGPYAGLVADLEDEDSDPVIGPVVDRADDAGDDADGDDTVLEGGGALGDDAVLAPAWGGDASILEDHGLEAAALTSIVERSPDPGTAVMEIAKRLGFDELVDAWH